ncbi:MAG: DUF3006 domain-containing protein [Clostridia bacterium]|nr:DUF3006 domain-containing protein [Clostridia bacterium]
MFYTINRIEEELFVVLTDDDGRKYDVRVSEMPQDLRIGNVYELIDGVYIYNEKETEKRRSAARNRTKRFFQNI